MLFLNNRNNKKKPQIFDLSKIVVLTQLSWQCQAKGKDLSESGKQKVLSLFPQNSDFEQQMAFLQFPSLANGSAIQSPKSEFVAKKGFTLFVYQIHSSPSL